MNALNWLWQAIAALQGSLRRARPGSGITVLAGRIGLLLTGSVTAVLLPIIASHGAVGDFFVAQTLIAGGAILCQLGSTVSIPRMIAERLASDDRAGAKEVAYSGLHLVLLAGLSVATLVASLVVLSAPLIPELQRDGTVVLIIAASVVFASLLTVLAEMHRAREAFGLASLLPLGSSVAVTLFAFAAWRLGLQAELSALLFAGLAGLVAFTLAGVEALMLAMRTWGGTPKKTYGYESILQASWPNLVTTAVLFVVAQADLWIVALLGRPLELANYGVALRLSSLILLPLATVNGLLSPLIVKAWTRGKKRALQRTLTRTVTAATLVAFAGYVCFLTLGWRAIPVVWGDSYRPVFEIVAILGFGQVVHTAGGSAGHLLVLLGQQRFVMRVTLTIGAAMILLGLAAMTFLDINGLATVFCLGLVIQTVAFASRARRRLDLLPAVTQALFTPGSGDPPDTAGGSHMPADVPPVSIVIPVFNCGAYVGDAIRSVLGQRYPSLELIVVDDGSTDNTAAIIQEFGPQLRAIRQENAGQSAALNAGWEAAQGELLGYLAADDLLRPQAVARAVELLRRRPEVVAVYPDFRLIDADSRQIGIVRTPRYDQRRLIAGADCLPGPGLLFRRKAWQIAGGWSRQLRQVPDLEFFFRLALVGPFARLPQVLADFRVHRGSATHGWISVERAEEPMAAVESFFARADLPPHVTAWRRASHASAAMLCGLMHAQSGRYRMALRSVGRAVLAHPGSLVSTRVLSLVKRLLRPGSRPPKRVQSNV